MEVQPEHPAPHVLDLLIDLAVLEPHVVEHGVGLPRPGQVGGLKLPVVLLGQTRLDPPGRQVALPEIVAGHRTVHHLSLIHI